MRKISFAGIELKSQSARELQGTSELPGRPLLHKGVLVRVLNLRRDQTSLARAGGGGIFLLVTGFHA